MFHLPGDVRFRRLSLLEDRVYVSPDNVCLFCVKWSYCRFNLAADKGRASVVLDKNSYDDKMKTLIEKGPYRLLNKDPTDRLSRKLTEKLLNLKRGGHLTESVYNKIRPKHKQPPRIYDLPKIYKVNTPLKPIVSCVNDLSSYLADALSPLTGKLKYTVNNSAHFVSTINGERVLESEIMVSFDVQSNLYITALY